MSSSLPAVMILAERRPSVARNLVKNPPWISQAPSANSPHRHKASVCSVNRCVAGGHIAHQSAVWKIPQCGVSFFPPSFQTIMPEQTLSIFHSSRLDVFCRTEDCCCFHRTGLSDPRPPRRTPAPEKSYFKPFLHQKKKKKGKNAEKPQSNLKSSVSSGRHSAHRCHHLSDVIAACRSKTCGHIFPGGCRHGAIKANIHQV